MVKVCHLTTVHQIDDVRIFLKECISLSASGFDVTLIACSNTAFEDVKNGVKRISLYVPVKNRLQRMIKRTSAVYKKALEVDADIYHFHDPELLPIGLKLKRKGKKIIFDSHEFYGEQILYKHYIPFLLRSFIASVYMGYEKYVCKRIDAVIQVCTLNGKDYFNNRAKISEFITNAPVKNSSSYHENRLPCEERDKVIHIGSLTHSRGITHLIEAAAKSKISLILAGHFASPEYHEQLKCNPAYPAVDYRGYLTSIQINEVLCQAYAGISTLLHIGQYPKIDTFPTKVYDYMAAGLPVILSDTQYAKRINEKHNIGICVNPENVEEISNAILFLKENKTMAKEMGLNGRMAFEKEFNWDIEVIKLINLYNQIAQY